MGHIFKTLIVTAGQGIKVEPTTDEFIQNVYDTAMQKLNAFYKINWTDRTPNIFIMPDRNTVDIIRKEKTETWLKAWTQGIGIYILDRNKYEPENEYAKADAYYETLIIHEFSHPFFAIASDGHTKPNWLNEGTAMYVSGQTKLFKTQRNTSNKTIDFKTFLEYYNKHDKGIYAESGIAVEVLANNFGNEKLLGLITKLKTVDSINEFNYRFAHIYGFKPSYEKFNELLKKR